MHNRLSSALRWVSLAAVVELELRITGVTFEEGNKYTRLRGWYDTKSASRSE